MLAGGTSYVLPSLVETSTLLYGCICQQFACANASPLQEVVHSLSINSFIWVVSFLLLTQPIIEPNKKSRENNFKPKNYSGGGIL